MDSKNTIVIKIIVSITSPVKNITRKVTKGHLTTPMSQFCDKTPLA